MKREELIKHLRKHGCAFVREGGESFLVGERIRKWSVFCSAS